MSLGDDLRMGMTSRTAELRALAHPLRLRILSLLTGAPMTAAEVARELGITHANASYHLRQLLAVGTIEVAAEEHIRGGRAKRYRYDVDRDLARTRMEEPPDRAGEGAGDTGPARDPRLLLTALAVELQRRANHVQPAPGSFLTDAELWVEPDTLHGIRDQFAKASTDLHHAAKPPRSPGTIRVSATVALFRMEPDA
jgi:DNA-binding transcriptional ArsR family regulator